MKSILIILFLIFIPIYNISNWRVRPEIDLQEYKNYMVGIRLLSYIK
jgi:hypothetical protein